MSLSFHEAFSYIASNIGRAVRDKEGDYWRFVEGTYLGGGTYLELEMKFSQEEWADVDCFEDFSPFEISDV